MLATVKRTITKSHPIAPIDANRSVSSIIAWQRQRNTPTKTTSFWSFPCWYNWQGWPRAVGYTQKNADQKRCRGLRGNAQMLGEMEKYLLSQSKTFKAFKISMTIIITAIIIAIFKSIQKDFLKSAEKSR